jgi:hypothetical protein
VTDKSEQITRKFFNSLEIASQMGFPIAVIDGGPLWVRMGLTCWPIFVPVESLG